MAVDRFHLNWSPHRMDCVGECFSVSSSNSCWMVGIAGLLRRKFRLQTRKALKALGVEDTNVAKAELDELFVPRSSSLKASQLMASNPKRYLCSAKTCDGLKVHESGCKWRQLLVYSHQRGSSSD